MSEDYTGYECARCGFPTLGQLYCSESCREADCLPVCETCGDKIAPGEDWDYDESGADEVARHAHCPLPA